MKNAALTNAMVRARLMACPASLRIAISNFQYGAARMSCTVARYSSALIDCVADLLRNEYAVGLMNPVGLVSLYGLCEVLQ